MEDVIISRFLPRRLPLAIGLMTAVAGCAAGERSGPVPPSPGELTTSLAAEAAQQELAEDLRQEGFTVTTTSSGLEATSSDPRHAACETLWVKDPMKDGQRGNFTDPSSTTTTIDIDLEGLNGRSRVRWQARHEGRYRNVFTNLYFTEPCPGSGTVDRLVRDALPVATPG